MIPDEDLRNRLRDHEDGWTERKSKGIKTSDITKTIVAFANSLPNGHQAVLFIGIADQTGEVEGVGDLSDDIQKRVREAAEKRAYPPIYSHNCRVIKESEKDVVAVIVEASNDRPHFAGPSYVRVGSESINASPKQFDELIASRTSIARLIFDVKQKDEIVLVELVRHKFERHRIQCKVSECNPHFANFCGVQGGEILSGSLKHITASFVGQMNMLMFTINEGF